MAGTLPRRRLLLAALASLAATRTAADAAREGVAKERADVPEAKPVTVGGVRYEAPPWLRARGLPHNGGHVVAHDAASGAELWVVRIYGPSGPADMEQDKREVFIVGMQPSPSGRYLWITDERARRWSLDLKTRRVRRLQDRPAPR